jgi:toxin YoeB
VNLVFAPQGWEDYLYWQRNDPEMVSRINLLIKDIMRHPYDGIGKPESLKHALRGFWSRRNKSYQPIGYKKFGTQIFIAQLRYHYR